VLLEHSVDEFVGGSGVTITNLASSVVSGASSSSGISSKTKRKRH